MKAQHVGLNPLGEMGAVWQISCPPAVRHVVHTEVGAGGSPLIQLHKSSPAVAKLLCWLVHFSSCTLSTCFLLVSGFGCLLSFLALRTAWGSVIWFAAVIWYLIPWEKEPCVILGLSSALRVVYRLILWDQLWYMVGGEEFHFKFPNGPRVSLTSVTSVEAVEMRGSSFTGQ